MKTMMNFTNTPDDLSRYQSAEDLRSFYRRYGCDGLELMPLEDSLSWITPEMIVGVHACCTQDWMNLDRGMLLAQYRKDLDFAQKVHAEYVVFHVTQISMDESLTYHFCHTDAEVIDAAADFINELLDGQTYHFHFLMENLWWPGLNLLEPSLTARLLDRVHYPKKGLMLDTGHFLHTNRSLRTQDEAVDWIRRMLDRHESLLPYIKGVHLHQSLSGAYVDEYLKNPPPVETDSDKRFCQLFEHIFQIDRHEPFTASGVRELVERIAPDYLTYEYITRSREEHANYLAAGSRIMQP